MRHRPASFPEGNQIQRNKLIGSKWTARQPQHNEKHFIVLDWVESDNAPRPEKIEIEAVYSRRVYTIYYQELKNAERWQIGWH